MKLAGLLALALVLLVPASADARKRCRPHEGATPPTAEAPADEAEATSDLHWARGNDSSWVHAVEPSWHHDSAESWHDDEAADLEPAAYEADDGDVGAAWLHETDYGWWAAVPDAALSEPGADGQDETEEDCTVSKRRNECVVLANQVAHYRFRLGLAEARDDGLWAESLEATIARLEARAERRGCPWALQPSIQEQIKFTVSKVLEAAGVAAQVAAMFYRMGLL